MLFAQYANDWRRVLKFLISLFDNDALGKVEKNTEYTWGVKAIALQVAQQIPFSFFDVGLVNDSKVPQEDLYFLRDNRSNPALRNETPLVQFWLMCASIFDHPWTMLFDEFLEESPIPCIQEIKLKVIEGFPNDETSKVDIHKGVKKIFDPDYEDSEEEDDPMGDEDTGLVNKFGQPDGWDSDKTVDDNSNNRRHDMDIDGEFDSGDDRIHDDNDDKDEVEEDDEDTDESTKDSVILVENSYKTTDTENEEDTNYMGLNTDEVVSELTGVTGEDKDPELASPPRKKGRSHRVLVVDQSTEMDVDGSSLSEPGAKRTHSTSASQSTTPTAQKTDTTSTKQSSKAKRRLQRSLTLEERLDGLRQVNLDGMVGQAILVELGMAYSYQGQQGVNTTHASIILNHILDTLADVLKNAEETIRFLPLSESAYKKSKQWIRTEADLWRLIPDYRSLSKYLDMSFGNMSYALTSNKPGEKKLRTRMRVGFEVEVAAGTIRQYLHGELRPQGFGAGCYESVLQFGDIEKIGALCFYPQEINIRAMEKELMQHFDWKTVIGLRYKWVNIPYNCRSKWNERSPGCMMWHVYVRSRDAKRADRELRLWLHPSTPKKDFPWCAVTHYISDWKAAQNGTISVKAVGPVKDENLTMISKHNDFVELTQAKYCPVEIPGMLKQATTKAFGPRTCLSMFLSIKARPVHADKVAAADVNSDSDSDDSLLEDVSHKFTKVTVKGKTKIKKQPPK
ncbi:unnamed protein product, partial [Cylindrotheca closterium]